MCFSNLPIEFDDEGNPYLAEEADDVEQATDCGCDADSDTGIDESDPEDVFQAVLSTVPESVRAEFRKRDGESQDELNPGETAAVGYADDPAEGD